MMVYVCTQQHQGAPKVEKVFFTTAIPVGGNAGKLMFSEYYHVVDIGQKGVNHIFVLLKSQVFII